MVDSNKPSEISKPSLSPHRAVTIGQLVVNLPVLAIMVSGFLLADAFRHSYWAFAFAGLGFVFAWLWWSVAVPLWRDWAKRSGADEEETQILGQRSGLVWRKGSVFEKTEIRVRRPRSDE
jgi:hypothetical protein